MKIKTTFLFIVLGTSVVFANAHAITCPGDGDWLGNNEANIFVNFNNLSDAPFKVRALGAPTSYSLIFNHDNVDLTPNTNTGYKVTSDKICTDPTATVTDIYITNPAGNVIYLHVMNTDYYRLHKNEISPAGIKIFRDEPPPGYNFTYEHVGSDHWPSVNVTITGKKSGSQ